MRRTLTLPPGEGFSISAINKEHNYQIKMREEKKNSASLTLLAFSSHGNTKIKLVLFKFDICPSESPV